MAFRKARTNRNPEEMTQEWTPPAAPAGLFVGVRAKAHTDIAKFQKILSWYNTRDENQAEALGGIDLYIYRQFPKIDYKKIAGQPYAYIEKIVGVTEEGVVNPLPENLLEYLTHKHGGGRYKISLNDKSKSDETQVAMSTTKVDEIEHDPIITLKGLVETDPETSAWVARQISIGKLGRAQDGELYEVNGRNGVMETATGSSNADVAREAIRAMHNPAQEHAARKSIDLVADTARELMSRQNQPDPVAQFRAMAEIMKGNGADNNMLTIVLQGMMNQNATLLQLALAKREPETASDPLATMERALGIISKISGRGKAVEEPGGWMSILKEVIPALLPIAARFAPVGAAPAAAPAAGAPVAIAAAGPPTLQPQQVEDFAARALRCIQRGQGGDKFAESIEVFHSPELYDTITAVGIERVTQALMSSSHAQELSQFGPVFTTFLRDFFEYGEDSKDDDATPAAPIETAPATKEAAAAA